VGLGSVVDGGSSWYPVRNNILNLSDLQMLTWERSFPNKLNHRSSLGSMTSSSSSLPESFSRKHLRIGISLSEEAGDGDKRSCRRSFAVVRKLAMMVV
jgi:hypothetical protein